MSPTLHALLTVARQRLAFVPASTLLLALAYAADINPVNEPDDAAWQGAHEEALALFSEADLAATGREANTRIVEAVARRCRRAA